MSEDTTDPLVSGVKSAAIHLVKAGFEIFAAFGAVASGVSRKVRPSDPDDERGPERVPVD